MAPDLERLARTPWPIACCASSGTRLFNSALTRSCSRNAGCVRVNAPANSAQALDVLISTTRTASMRGFGGSTPNGVGGLAALDTAPELACSRDNQVLIERVGMGGDLDPFAAAGDHRQGR